MTLIVIAAVFVAVLVWVYVAYRRELARIPAPTVEDPRLSASCGGFGPEWDALLTSTRTEETNR
jgi:hypothetical protein